MTTAPPAEPSAGGAPTRLSGAAPAAPEPGAAPPQGGTPPPETGGTPQGGTPPPETGGTPPPSAPPLLGDDLSLRPGWTAELGEEYAQYSKTGAKFDNLGGLLKSYANLEGLRGIPGADATAEQREAFRNANRIPGEVADYTKAIPLPQLPNGQEIPAEILGRAAQAGLDANMTPAQMGAMIDLQLQVSGEAVQAQQAAEAQAKDEAFAKLEQEWGRDKDANYSNAMATAELLGLDVNDPNIGDNPSLVRALAQMHSKLDEDTLRGVQAAGPAGNSGGIGERAKARDIVTNPANPLYAAYHDPSDPAHATAHQKVDMYNAAATGFRE